MFPHMKDSWIWSCNTIRKIDVGFADLVALNKFDKRGALDAAIHLVLKNNTNAIIIFGT
jgi:hypothetical protein